MRLAVAAALALMLAPGAALSHPHVLIDSHVIVQFEGGRIAALQMGWKFDPVYSGSLAQDYDADKNGALSATERDTLEQEAFQDTAQYSYLTHAQVDGKPVTWPKADNFKPMVFKESMVYSFRLKLPQPVDPRRQAFRLSTYEESYYIDIDFPNEAAIQLIGDGAAGCRASLSPDPENKLFGGIIVPNKVEITCDP